MQHPADLDRCLHHLSRSVSAWLVPPGWLVFDAMFNMQGNVLSCNMTSLSFNLVDFTPDWDYTVGGAKMIITFKTSGAGFADRQLIVMFDDNQVRSHFRCGIPTSCCAVGYLESSRGRSRHHGLQSWEAPPGTGGGDSVFAQTYRLFGWSGIYPVEREAPRCASVTERALGIFCGRYQELSYVRERFAAMFLHMKRAL